jgi:hypothetical protein
LLFTVFSSINEQREELAVRLRAPIVLSAALFLCFSAAAQSQESKSPATAGFSVTIPSTWTERPNFESLAVQGFKKADPNDTDLAFAWGNPDNTAFVLIQATTSTALVRDGTFRTELTSFHTAIRDTTTAASTTTWDLSDDGTTMTSKQEGDMQTSLHVVGLNEGAIDSGRHLRGFSAMCILPKPVGAAARSACDSILASFKITLDASTLLPLEAMK